MNDAKSWSPSLHDAELVSFTSSLTDRTATLDVEIEHLGDESGKGASFRFVFHTVRAIIAAKWELWAHHDRAADHEELMERRDWGRMVSIEPGPFAGPWLRIHDADQRTSRAADLPWPFPIAPPESVVKMLNLDIDGTGSEIGSLALTIVFERLDVLRDGNALTIEEFLSLGESYWERWSARHRTDPT